MAFGCDQVQVVSGHESDDLASPLSVSAKRSNKFDYSRYGSNVSPPMNVVTTQTALTD